MTSSSSTYRASPLPRGMAPRPGRGHPVLRRRGGRVRERAGALRRWWAERLGGTSTLGRPGGVTMEKTVGNLDRDQSTRLARYFDEKVLAATKYKRTA